MTLFMRRYQLTHLVVYEDKHDVRLVPLRRSRPIALTVPTTVLRFGLLGRRDVQSEQHAQHGQSGRRGSSSRRRTPHPDRREALQGAATRTEHSSTDKTDRAPTWESTYKCLTWQKLKRLAIGGRLTVNHKSMLDSQAWPEQ